MMEGQRFYEKKKRALEDFCNICGEKKRLTYDHIPPKCCFNSFKSVPLDIFSLKLIKDRKCSQNGVKHRSICAECNNGILGKYDKEFELFIQKVKNVLVQSESPKGVIMITTRINRLVRSICGHFLSMKAEYYAPLVPDRLIRDFIRNENMKRPEGLKILTWYYPYSTVFSISDFTVLSTSPTQNLPCDGMVSALSSFPLAFLIKDGEKDCGLVDLFDYCTENFEEEVEIPIDLDSCYFKGTDVLRDPRWPCNITNDDFGAPGILTSKNTVSNSVLAARDPEEIKRNAYTVRIKNK